MKRILLVLNGNLTPPHVIDSAINLASITSSLLHTVFIDDKVDLAEYSYPFPNDLSLTRNNLTGKTVAEENASLLESNIQLFKDECETAKVDFFIEPFRKISIGDLINFSVFSDFILADGNENISEHHITELLVKAHCPIYLISRNIEKTENIILMYDASISSVYAIKLYSYLFPELKDLPTHLVHINSEKSEALPQEENIKMWLSNRFSNLQVKVLHGKITDEIVNYTKSIPNSLTVMGSYGRSTISRFFHGSLANDVIEKVKSSVFITHK